MVMQWDNQQNDMALCLKQLFSMRFLPFHFVSLGPVAPGSVLHQPCSIAMTDVCMAEDQKQLARLVQDGAPQIELFNCLTILVGG